MGRLTTLVLLIGVLGVGYEICDQTAPGRPRLLGSVKAVAKTSVCCSAV